MGIIIADKEITVTTKVIQLHCDNHATDDRDVVLDDEYNDDFHTSLQRGNTSAISKLPWRWLYIRMMSNEGITEHLFCSLYCAKSIFL